MSQHAERTAVQRPRPDRLTRSLLFVYGGTHPGLRRQALLYGQRLLGVAVTAPRYRLYDVGQFPGLVRDSATGVAVRGELWAVHCGVLDRIDDHEQSAELFRRELISVQGCASPVPAYLYSQAVPETAPSGDRWPLPAGEELPQSAGLVRRSPFSLRTLLAPDATADPAGSPPYRTGASSRPRRADVPARAAGRGPVALQFRLYPLNPPDFPGLVRAAPGFRAVPRALLADRKEPEGGWLRQALRELGFEVDDPARLVTGFLREDWNGHPGQALTVVGERGLAVSDAAAAHDASV